MFDIVFHKTCMILVSFDNQVNQIGSKQNKMFSTLRNTEKLEEAHASIQSIPDSLKQEKNM